MNCRQPDCVTILGPTLLMSRGDRREDIVLDDVDRQDFRRIGPGGAGVKPSWPLAAKVTLPNWRLGRGSGERRRFQSKLLPAVCTWAPPRALIRTCTSGCA